MKQIIIPYVPRQQMEAYHETQKRWRVVICHRRFGKTTAIINNKIKNALTDPRIFAEQRNLKVDSAKIYEWRKTPRLFGYIAPYYSQAKSIAWDVLKYYSSFVPGVEINESELRVDFPGGGRVRLFGADNPNSLRGLKWWDVDLDEYSQHSPDWEKEILLPGCLDFQAPIGYWGTIIGKNHLWKLHDKHQDDPEWFSLYLKASETGVLRPEFLEAERRMMGDPKFLQEYELEPTAAIEGAILGDEIRWLWKNGRIVNIPLEQYAPVDTYWDLGINDYTVVLMVQAVGLERRVVDHYWAQNRNLGDIAKDLQDKGYRWGTHFLPHDARQRELQTGKTREEFLRAVLPGEFEITRMPKKKEDGINEVKLHYKKLWIDKKLTVLIEALEQYKRDFDPKRQVFLDAPKHDWASHHFDALQTFALSERGRVFNNTSPQLTPQTEIPGVQWGEFSW